MGGIPFPALPWIAEEDLVSGVLERVVRVVEGGPQCGGPEARDLKKSQAYHPPKGHAVAYLTGGRPQKHVSRCILSLTWLIDIGFMSSSNPIKCQCQH